MKRGSADSGVAPHPDFPANVARRKSISFGVWGILAVLLNTNSVIGRTITLDSQSNIQITLAGNPAERGKTLTQLLERYLLRALHKQTPTGKGDPIEFLIRSDAPTWDKLPYESLHDASDIDSFEIAIRATPKPDNGNLMA